MYAIFRNGGKQYRVSKGQIVRLEKLNTTTNNNINFTEVLMIANGNEIKVGTPIVSNSVIKAKIISCGRSKKINIVKFRRRKHYRKHQGHRQWFTDVKIIDICVNDLNR